MRSLKSIICQYFNGSVFNRGTSCRLFWNWTSLIPPICATGRRSWNRLYLYVFIFYLKFCCVLSYATFKIYIRHYINCNTSSVYCITCLIKSLSLFAITATQINTMYEWHLTQRKTESKLTSIIVKQYKIRNKNIKWNKTC